MYGATIKQLFDKRKLSTISQFRFVSKILKRQLIVIPCYFIIILLFIDQSSYV